MRVDVIATWQQAPRPLVGAVVVLDVLRWSTVVVTALGAGATRVEAFASPEETLARVRALRAAAGAAAPAPDGLAVALAGGERGNHRLPGFDLGNSPLEYTPAVVQGRVVCTTTTNGTQALAAAEGGDPVFVASFLNLHATAGVLRAMDVTSVTVLCAGSSGTDALEDSACAGALVEWFLAAQALGPASLTAGAREALRVWGDAGRTPGGVFALAPHANALRRAGYEADVTAAAQLNTVPVVAVAKAGQVHQLTGIPTARA